MKELATGLQVFENIRKANALYVDKTDMIYDLVSGARMQYFISRPRRFGKTLLCWTLNALFSGKKELFDGLAISKTDWGWESYPVIHLDMSEVCTDGGVDEVRRSLIELMEDVAYEHEIDLRGTTIPGSMLRRVIHGVAKKHSTPVVVIVDEYDRPFLNFYDKPRIAQEIREIMRSYYSTLKASERHMRFLFMTGISKFTKAGVFSTLNNLNDLSLNEKFGALLGYTEKELVECFNKHLEAGAEKLNMPVNELVEKLRRHYNGFCFDGVQKVYCPFSVLNFFSSHDFLNYWMDSGNPKVVADYMKNRNLTVEQFRGMTVPRNFAFSPGEIETAPPESFLYQAGYLTLREKIGDDFTLDYPNAEVLNSMSELVYKNMTQNSGDFVDLRTPLLCAIADGNCELLIETLNRLLASIPYDDYINAAKQAILLSGTKITAQEWLYRSTILAFFRGCGVLTFGEVHTCQGRSDMLAVYRDAPWIIEIKVAGNNDCAAQVKNAMKQIGDKCYAGPYKNAKKLAIAIDDKLRQIGEWIVG